MSTLTLFDKYKTELEEDTKLDELNIKQFQLKLPGVKHKWTSRLIQTKRDLARLKKLKRATQQKLLNQVKSEAHVELSDVALSKKIGTLEPIQNIDEQIEDTENVVLYLEKVEKIFNTMTYDVKNMIDLIKLETL